jgi:hypothetical protein
VASVADEAAPELVARRARWFVLSNLVTALVILALALLNVGYQFRMGGPAWVAVLLVAMVAAYAWQAARQLFDRQPIVAVCAHGLLLPTARTQPIAWASIHDVALSGRLGRGQIDITLDNALITQLTLGQRFLGDSVVKRRGLVPGITILASNLDQRAQAIVAAIRRHWPAAEGRSG